MTIAELEAEDKMAAECACVEPKVVPDCAICQGCGRRLPTIIVTEREWSGRSLSVSVSIPILGPEEEKVVIRTVVDNGRRVGPLIKIPLRVDGYTFEQWNEVVTLVSRLKAKWENKGG